MSDDTLKKRLRDLIVRNAAGVLADVKPAAMFNLTADAREVPQEREFGRQAHRVALRVTHELGTWGVCVDVLVVRGRRALLLVRRAGRIASVVSRSDVRKFLEGRGYATCSERRVVACLRYELGRATACACDGCPDRGGCTTNPWREELAYPHEVGVLLGYPLADVQAFIARRGQGGVAVGTWKAYADVEGARRSWELLRACRREARERYERGATLEELIA